MARAWPSLVRWSHFAPDVRTKVMSDITTLANRTFCGLFATGPGRADLLQRRSLQAQCAVGIRSDRGQRHRGRDVVFAGDQSHSEADMIAMTEVLIDASCFLGASK